MKRTKLDWNRSNNNYITRVGDFVFRLNYQNIGVYGFGKCFGLQVRRIDESEFKYLNYTFVVKSDGHHIEKKYSVGGIIYDEEQIDIILSIAEVFLKHNMYI